MLRAYFSVTIWRQRASDPIGKALRRLERKSESDLNHLPAFLAAHPSPGETAAGRGGSPAPRGRIPRQARLPPSLAVGTFIQTGEGSAFIQEPARRGADPCAHCGCAPPRGGLWGRGAGPSGDLLPTWTSRSRPPHTGPEGAHPDGVTCSRIPGGDWKGQPLSRSGKLPNAGHGVPGRWGPLPFPHPAGLLGACALSISARAAPGGLLALQSCGERRDELWVRRPPGTATRWEQGQPYLPPSQATDLFSPLIS